MKTKFLFIILIGLLGCGIIPDEPDYRQPYTGGFTFSTIKNLVVMCYEPSATCVNGWTVKRSDTTIFTSKVELMDSIRLKIQFGDSISGLEGWDLPLDQTITPIVSTTGELTIQQFQNGITQVIGSFIGLDTLRLEMKYKPFSGMGGYCHYSITGVRNP